MVGNLPNYNEMDILRAFIFLEERMSRQDLARKLELGEGTIRTILDILKKKGLIRSTNKGHTFTEKGSRARHRIFGKISMPKEVKLHLYDQYRRVGIVYRAGRKIKMDYTLRDFAVKAGAEGAIILRYEKGRGLSLDYDAGYSFEYLEDKFDFKDNDILIITFAKTAREAENAGLSVITSLGRPLFGL